MFLSFHVEFFSSIFCYLFRNAQLKIFSTFSGAKWRKNEKCDDKEVPTSSNYECQRHDDLLMSSPLPSTSSASTSHANCEQSVPQQQHLQHQHLIESDTTKLLNTTSSSTDDRISPNIFLNLNFDNTSMDQNSLKFEWSTFNPNIPLSSTAVPSTMNFKYQQSNSYISTSPTYEFLNVDHFNIDSFKNECMLSLDQTMLSSVNDSQIMLSNDNINNFTMDDDGKDLLDLEKPININIGNLDSEKYC